jgi:hypothetical protein
MFAILGDINGEMVGRAVNHVYSTKILEQTICSKNFFYYVRSNDKVSN